LNPQTLYLEDNNHFYDPLLLKSKSEEYGITTSDDFDKKIIFNKTNSNQYTNLITKKSDNVFTKNKPFEEHNKEIYFSKRK